MGNGTTAVLILKANYNEFKNTKRNKTFYIRNIGLAVNVRV